MILALRLSAVIVTTGLVLAACSSSSQISSLQEENGRLRNEIVERDQQIDALRKGGLHPSHPDVGAAEAGVPGMATSADEDVDQEVDNALNLTLPLNTEDASN